MTMTLRPSSVRSKERTANPWNIGGGPYVCPECLQVFRTPEELSPHLERHREVEIAEQEHENCKCRACEGKGIVQGVKPKVCKNCGGKGRFWVPLYHPCPKGCGRHFKRVKGMREHIYMCDGSPPLARPTVEQLLEMLEKIRSA